MADRSSRTEGKATRNRSPVLLALLAAACLSGCSAGSGPRASFGPESDFETARAEYDRGHLVAAIELLEAFERNHPGSQYIDDALYYLGLARQKNNEYLLARAAFERVVEDFPRSPLVEDARFETARSWFLAIRGAELDAEPAEEALASLRAYQRRYPEGTHKAEAEDAIAEVLGTLARKDFLNGETYMRLGRHPAARRYFEKSLATWVESPVSARALDGIARTYEAQRDWAMAHDSYQRLVAHLGNQPERYAKGKDLLQRARRKLQELAAPQPNDERSNGGTGGDAGDDTGASAGRSASGAGT